MTPLTKITRSEVLYRLGLFLLFGIAYFFCYQIPNLYPYSTPVMLPLGWLDIHTPFIPATFLTYLSDYPMVLSVVATQKSRTKYHELGRYTFGTLIICGFFFWFFPTAYPRPPYPEVSNPIVSFFMNLVGSADNPYNCFPSMHVGLATVAAWSMRDRGPKIFSLYVLWGFVISASTLTTKQHYFIDILGGISVGTSVCALDYFMVAPFLQKRRNRSARPELSA